MANLGHVAVGMWAGRSLFAAGDRRTVGSMIVCSGLAMLPHPDYMGVMMGVADSATCHARACAGGGGGIAAIHAIHASPDDGAVATEGAGNPAETSGIRFDSTPAG